MRYIKSTMLLFVVLATVAAQANMVRNHSFDTGNMSSWDTFGTGWRLGTGADARSGRNGVVNEIRRRDSDEFRGIHQTVTVLPDSLYSGGVYIRAVNVETVEAWFELQFLDRRGNVLSQHESTHVRANQDFTFVGLRDVLTPHEAVRASVRGIVLVLSAPTETAYVAFDDFLFAEEIAQDATEENWGFETGDFSSWTVFGPGWRVSTGDDAFSWTYGAVNDVLTTDTDEWRGIFQEVPVIQGKKYSAGVYIRALNVESSQSWMELQWLDAIGTTISQFQTEPVTRDQPFRLSSMHDLVAPRGAVSASVRGVVQMLSPPSAEPDFHAFDEFYFFGSE